MGSRIGLTVCFLLTQFTAAEIAYNETRTEGPMDGSGDKILEIRDVTGESFNTVKELGSSPKEINHNEIRSRLQHLESQLSLVLLSLRSNADKAMSQQVRALTMAYLFGIFM